MIKVFPFTEVSTLVLVKIILVFIFFFLGSFVSNGRYSCFFLRFLAQVRFLFPYYYIIYIIKVFCVQRKMLWFCSVSFSSFRSFGFNVYWFWLRLFIIFFSLDVFWNCNFLLNFHSIRFKFSGYIVNDKIFFKTRKEMKLILPVLSFFPFCNLYGYSIPDKGDGLRRSLASDFDLLIFNIDTLTVVLPVLFFPFSLVNSLKKLNRN